MLNVRIKFDYFFASEYPCLEKFSYRYAMKLFYKEMENHRYDLLVINTVKTDAFFINDIK